ncbi:MAG: undecaprenyl-diphosphate phosphatase [Labilithrix sp.]|nr:undecaprenyl-diphosphate phosphatase [Labilithrix sp.]MBX3208052.1 undecaprenyl-diphosphate phosphatase [Labilithrix sp.]MBX3222896.1 undecaprenyl-diphosphate phosphatase [Labilithrix sp.]
MNPLIAALLGLVEGVTEYLPVSSTGHLILASHALGHTGDAVDSFDIVIQLGAILAVVVHYRRLLVERTAGLFRRERASLALLFALVLGFAPTAVVGLLLRKKIKALLFGPGPVAAALVVGGVVMIAVELVRAARAKRAASTPGERVPDPGLVGLEHVTPGRAFLIGLGQCVSMWPGSSRSMCTIVAGQLTGLSTATAAEFSFLLGLPTLGAATVYEAYKSREVLGQIGGANVVIGLVVSFVVAWAVIAAFLAYLKKRGLVPFGVYRILLGAAVFLLLVR